MDDDVGGRTQRNDFKMNTKLWVLLQTEQKLEELLRRFTPEFTIDLSADRKKKLTEAAMKLLQRSWIAREWVFGERSENSDVHIPSLTEPSRN
jgi:hypothetical protein